MKLLTPSGRVTAFVYSAQGPAPIWYSVLATPTLSVALNVTVGAVVYQPLAAGVAGSTLAVVTGAISSAGAASEQEIFASPHTPWAPLMAPAEIGST